MLYYTDVPGATQTTNAVINTENDCFFITPGASRSVFINMIASQGRGANLTNISGISFRLKKWTTTASSGGSAITPTPNDPGFAAAAHTAGFAAATVTSGTGGPVLLLSIGTSTTGPGLWMLPPSNLDAAYKLNAGATQSMDIFNVASAVSLVYEMSIGTAEG